MATRKYKLFGLTVLKIKEIDVKSDIYFLGMKVIRLPNKYGRLKRSYGVDIRPNTSDFDMFRQVFSDEEYACLNVLSSPKTILDIGANVGYTAVYLSCLFPDAKIYSLEPDQGNFDALCKNVSHCRNVTPLNYALSDKDHDMYVVTNAQSSDECAFQVSDEKNEMVRSKVRAVCMDTLLKELKISRADILKIDIEGSEKEVFEAKTDWLEKVGSLCIELHDRFRPGGSRALFKAMLKHPEFILENTPGESLFFTRRSQKGEK